MKLYIVEDDTMLRNNLSLLLNGEPDIDVTGSFSNAEDALQALSNLKALCQLDADTDRIPDIILVDIGLPGMSGVEFIFSAKKMVWDIEFMAFTVFEDKETIFAAIKAGASGYLLKGSTPRDLVEALFSLHKGGAPMSPRIARAVITEFRSDTIPEQFLLTAREKEVLILLEKGLTYKRLLINVRSVPILSIPTSRTFMKNSMPPQEKRH